MKKIVLLGVCWLHCVACSHAQKLAGYLGRKTTISLDMLGFPSLIDRSSAINLQAGLCVGRVISRRLVLGVSVHEFGTKFRYAGALAAGNANIIGWNAGLALSHFGILGAKLAAPLGPYQKIEAKYYRYRITDRSFNYYADRREYLGRNANVSIGYELGTQRVVYNYLSVHLGLNASLVFPLLTNDAGVEITRLSDERLRAFSMINLVAGFGFLLP